MSHIQRTEHARASLIGAAVKLSHYRKTKVLEKEVRSKNRFTCNLYPPERNDVNSNYVLGGLGAAFLLHSN